MLTKARTKVTNFSNFSLKSKKDFQRRTFKTRKNSTEAKNLLETTKQAI
jgi:hypothetical protein